MAAQAWPSTCQGGGQPGGGGFRAAAPGADGGPKGGKDDVIDAEFEVKK